MNKRNLIYTFIIATFAIQANLSYAKEQTRKPSSIAMGMVCKDSGNAVYVFSDPHSDGEQNKTLCALNTRCKRSILSEVGTKHPIIFSEIEIKDLGFAKYAIEPFVLKTIASQTLVCGDREPMTDIGARLNL